MASSLAGGREGGREGRAGHQGKGVGGGGSREDELTRIIHMLDHNILAASSLTGRMAAQGVTW